jgi:hypothetical protein
MKNVNQFLLTMCFLGILPCAKSQSAPSDTLRFPSTLIPLNNGYSTLGVESLTAVYELEYGDVEGQRGIPDRISIDILIILNKSLDYCLIRPNGVQNCTHKTYLYGRKLKTEARHNFPSLSSVVFSYDIYFKGKLCQRKTDTSNQKITEKSLPITIQIKVPLNEVTNEKGKSKYKKLDDVIEDVDIKNITIKSFTYSVEMIAFFNKLAQADLPAYNQEKTEEHTAEHLENEKRAAEESRLASEKKKLEETRLAEEKHQAELKRILEEKRLIAERQQADETQKIEENPIVADKQQVDEKRKLEEKRLATEKQKVEEERLAAEKQRVDENRKIEEKRLAGESSLAEEKRLVEEKLRIAEEKLRVAEEKQRLIEEQRKADLILSETNPKIPTANTAVTTLVTTVTQPKHVNRYRLGAKVLIPNILGASLEYIPPIKGNRLGIVVDYSQLNVPPDFQSELDLGDGVKMTYNYLAVGTNLYLNRKKRGGGAYFGLRYQEIAMKTALVDDEGFNGTLKQKAVALLFGASTGGHVWFGFELGAGKFLGNIKGSYVEKYEQNKIKTTVDEPLSMPIISVGILPILNLKLGLSF